MLNFLPKLLRKSFECLKGQLRKLLGEKRKPKAKGEKVKAKCFCE